MANPLKDWKLGKELTVETRNNLPLQGPPIWDKDKDTWKTILSKKANSAPPNLKGKFFHWNGTLYEVMSQETIADQALIKDMLSKYPFGEKRVFFWVYLEEIDSRLALVLSRR